MRLPAYIGIFLIVSSCATVNTPTGGPKDKKPPKLVDSRPYNQQLNFKSKEIVLEFDEWIRFENIKEQLIITPRTEVEYEYSTRKNKATIKFLEALSDSTTYTLNFREGITDITEKNPWKDGAISFSTGSYIDTSYISGRVINHLKNEPAKDVVVSLYIDGDTTNILEHPPYYFTKTNAQGEFVFQNIRPDKYLIYAFNDLNKNVVLNPEKEMYGYHHEVLKLKDSINNLELHHQQYDIRKPEVRNSAAKGRYFEVNFNKGIQEYKIENPTSFSFPTVLFSGKRAIRFFKPEGFNRDSLITYIHVLDTIGMKSIDTVYVKFRDSKIAPEEFKATNSYKTAEKITNTFDFNIDFSKPIKEILYDSVFIFIDSGLVLTFNEQEITWNDHMTNVAFKKTVDIKELENKKKKIVQDRIARIEEDKKQKEEEKQKESQTEDTKTETDKSPTQGRSSPAGGSSAKGSTDPTLSFKLNINKAAFISIENDSSKEMRTTVTLKKAEDYGLIKGEVKIDYDHFIVQLLSSDFKVVDEVFNQKQYIFKMVPAAKYKVRVLVDLNKNGKWDPGSMEEFILPEPIVFLKEELTVRANWELIDKDIHIDMEKYVDRMKNKGE